MARIFATHRLVCRGNTKPVRQALKDKGWRWDAVNQSWHMLLVDAHAARIVEGDVEFFRGLGGHKKGCQLVLDGVVRWTSAAFGAPAEAPRQDGGQPDQDGFGWNVDAFGNPVSQQHIPGSAPDDMI